MSIGPRTSTVTRDATYEVISVEIAPVSK